MNTNQRQTKVLVVNDDEQPVKEELMRDIVSHSNAALAKPRDEEAWINPTYDEDKQLKKERSKNVSQHSTNTVLQSYLKHQGNMKANIHLTIGRQRI